MYKLISAEEKTLEVTAVESYLNWKKIPYQFSVDLSVLQYTEGKDIPILEYNNLIQAKGYDNIIQYVSSSYERI